MEQIVATALAVVILAACGGIVMYLIGSLACALIGAECGRLSKIGMGLLGLLAGVAMSSWIHLRLPPWLMWFVAAVLAAGIVFILRLLISNPQRSRSSTSP